MRGHSKKQVSLVCLASPEAAVPPKHPLRRVRKLADAGKTTTAVLEPAAKFLGQHEVKLMADSGVENINETVDEFLGNSVIERVLAQVQVRESNSMIEVFWSSLRHQWLYLHDLDSIERLREIVEFCVDQHNGVMPRAAFDGQTPDEMFFGTGAGGREGAGRETKVGPLTTAGREPIPVLCGLYEDGVLP